MKSVKMEGGVVKNNPNLRDVIYGWPQTTNLFFKGVLLILVNEENDYFWSLLANFEASDIFKTAGEVVKNG
jgi:hypothetical protein